MNKEAQRIAIARACGWSGPFTEVDEIIYGTHSKWKGQTSICGDQVQHIVPEYLNDLNACHEMENILELHECREFDERLAKMIVRDINLRPYADRFSFHATATQRCEAFLKTLGLWDYGETKRFPVMGNGKHTDFNASPVETTSNSLSKSAACATLKGAGKAGE